MADTAAPQAQRKPSVPINTNGPRMEHAPLQQKLGMTAIFLLHNLFCLAVLVKAITMSAGWSGYLIVVAGMVIGTIFADWVATMIHFSLDNYGDEHTPVLGLPIFYFREHHEHPLSMLKRDHIENVWTECLFTSFLVSMMLLTLPAHPCAYAAAAVTGFWGGQVTAIHKASHTLRPPLFYKVLQKLHLVIDRSYHAHHHRHFNSHHSLVNGFTDRVFAKLHILQFIECTIYLFTGAIAIHSTVGLTAPARKLFSERIQHLKWLIWYRLFDSITVQHNLALRFMNWGYHKGDVASAAGPYPMPDSVGRVLPSEPNLRVIDSASFQLYLHLASGVNIQGADIVEVSSGKGGGLACFASTGQCKSCTGIDLCEGNILYCRSSYADLPNLTFKLGDAMGDLAVQADVIFNVEASHCYPSRDRFFQSVHQALRASGRLLFVDFMSVEAVAAARKSLSQQFVLERDEDITGNVLLAMERTDNAKRVLIEQHVPSWLAHFVHRFAATKNSTMYRDLQGGQWVYHLFQARKI